jgi:hypothetical protein
MTTLRKAHEVRAEILLLRQSISDLYNQSQWMSSSALDRVDDTIGEWEDKIKALYEELENL